MRIKKHLYFAVPLNIDPWEVVNGYERALLARALVLRSLDSIKRLLLATYLLTKRTHFLKSLTVAYTQECVPALTARSKIMKSLGLSFLSSFLLSVGSGALSQFLDG